MKMLYHPKEYNSLEELQDASILNARSDTTEYGRDVFGYFDEETIYAGYIYDMLSGEMYAIPLL